MASIITTTRRTLQNDLKATRFTVLDAWPNDPKVPCIVIVPASATYIGAGQTFGEYVINVDVLCLASRDRYTAGLAALDDMVQAVIVNSQDWALLGVETPQLIGVGPQQVLGCVVSLAKAVRI